MDGRSQPLTDVRILAIEQYGAGPWGSMQLADLGADVIKIEDPASRGDIGRFIPPYQQDEDSLFFETFNRNKRSVSLDLRHPLGRDVLRALAARSDAVFCNLRGDLPARLGLCFEDLRDINPRIVCCSISGFGRTGPRAAQRAYDNVIQAHAGWMALAGEPDGPPEKTGLSLVDLSAGYVGALALLAGIWSARRDGVGCDCDISLFETALAELNYIGTWVATAGHVPTRAAESAHTSIVPFQNFATADGTIAVACSKETFWRRFCVAIERPDLAADERYETFQARDQHRDELVPQLRSEIARRTTAEWIDRMTREGVPVGSVNSVAQALADPQVQARDAISEAAHERFGTVRTVASPLRVGPHRLPATRAPRRGEHTMAVLTELGMDPDEIERLAASGAFGVDDVPDTPIGRASES